MRWSDFFVFAQGDDGNIAKVNKEGLALIMRLVLALCFGISLIGGVHLIHAPQCCAQAQQSESKRDGVTPESQASPRSSIGVEKLEQDQSYSLTLVSLDPQKIRVGDLLELRLNPSPQIPLQPQAPASLLEDGFEIDASHSSVGSIFLIPVRSGKLTLPALTLLNEQGQKTGETLPFHLDVQSVLTQEESLAVGDAVGVIPPLGVEFPLWLITLLGLILIGAIAWIFYFLKRRKKNPSTQLSSPVLDLRTEDEVALQELLELEKKELISKGKYKIYFFSISEILKKYIGARYRFHALEATTMELTSVLKTQCFLEELLLRELMRLFEDLDRVKFTDHVPSKDDSNQILLRAKQWVMKTKRVHLSIQQPQTELEKGKHASL